MRSVSASTTSASPRAVRAFTERLARAGVTLPPGLAATLTQGLVAATTRPAILAAAEAMLATLTEQGLVCSKSKVLEAIAASRGARNWAAYDASLPKPAVASISDVLQQPFGPDADLLEVVRQNRLRGRQLSGSLPGVRVEEQVDVLGGMVLVDYGVVQRRGVPGLEWIWMHPEDCRLGARRVACRLTGNDGHSYASVAVVEGLGAGTQQHARREGLSGRKELMWEANILAETYLQHPTRVATPDEQAERDAARVLCQAGFHAELHVDGVVWVHQSTPVRFTIMADATDEPVGVRADQPVLLEIFYPDDTDPKLLPFQGLAPALVMQAVALAEYERPGPPQPAPR